MKKVLIIMVILFSIIACGKNSSTYNFEGLRDTLGIDSSYIFVKECSPLYSDKNPYKLTGPRVKTLCYTVYYNRNTETTDTAVYAVLTDNSFVFWGKNEGNSHAKDLIEWTINNREKI